MEKMPSLTLQIERELMRAAAGHSRVWFFVNYDGKKLMNEMIELKLINRAHYDGCWHREYWLTAWGRKMAYEIWKKKGCPK